MVNDVSEQCQPGGPHLPMMSAFFPTRQVAVYLWYSHVKFNTRHAAYCKVVFKRRLLVVSILIPYHVFSHWFWFSAWRKWRNLNSALTTNKSKLRCHMIIQKCYHKQHHCDVYSAKLWILHAWFTIIQTMYCFRVSCLWGNMAATEVRIFVLAFACSLTSVMIWKEKGGGHTELKGAVYRLWAIVTLTHGHQHGRQNIFPCTCFNEW